MINALASFQSPKKPQNSVSEVFLSCNSLNIAVHIDETVLLDLLRPDFYVKFTYVMFYVVWQIDVLWNYHYEWQGSLDR